jgi:hypothetical protein
MSTDADIGDTTDALPVADTHNDLRAQLLGDHVSDHEVAAALHVHVRTAERILRGVKFIRVKRRKYRSIKNVRQRLQERAIEMPPRITRQPPLPSPKFLKPIDPATGRRPRGRPRREPATEHP